MLKTYMIHFDEGDLHVHAVINARHAIDAIRDAMAKALYIDPTTISATPNGDVDSYLSYWTFSAGGKDYILKPARVAKTPRSEVELMRFCREPQLPFLM